MNLDDRQEEGDPDETGGEEAPGERKTDQQAGTRCTDLVASLLKDKAGEKPDLLPGSRSAETIGHPVNDHRPSSQRMHRLPGRRPCTARRDGVNEPSCQASRRYQTTHSTVKVRVSKSCTTECEILKPGHALDEPVPGRSGCSYLYPEICHREDNSLFPHLEVDGELDSEDDMPLSNSTLLDASSDVDSEKSVTSCENTLVTRSDTGTLNKISDQESPDKSFRVRRHWTDKSRRNKSTDSANENTDNSENESSSPPCTPVAGSGRTCRILAYALGDLREGDADLSDGKGCSQHEEKSTSRSSTSSCSDKEHDDSLSTTGRAKKSGMSAGEDKRNSFRANPLPSHRAMLSQCDETTASSLPEISATTARPGSARQQSPLTLAGKRTPSYVSVPSGPGVKNYDTPSLNKFIEDAELLPLFPKPTGCRLQALETVKGMSEREAEWQEACLVNSRNHKSFSPLLTEIEKALNEVMKDEKRGNINRECQESDPPRSFDNGIKASQSHGNKYHLVISADSPVISILSFQPIKDAPECANYVRRDHNDVIHEGALIGGLRSETPVTSLLDGTDTCATLGTNQPTSALIHNDLMRPNSVARNVQQQLETRAAERGGFMGKISPGLWSAAQVRQNIQTPDKESNGDNSNTLSHVSMLETIDVTERKDDLATSCISNQLPKTEATTADINEVPNLSLDTNNEQSEMTSPTYKLDREKSPFYQSVRPRNSLGQKPVVHLPVWEYLSFYETLCHRSGLKKESPLTYGKILKMNKDNRDSLSAPATSDDNQADAEDNASPSPHFPRGHEIPPGWQPGQHKSNPITLMTASYSRGRHRNDGKSKRRKRQKSFLKNQQAWLKSVAPAEIPPSRENISDARPSTKTSRPRHLSGSQSDYSVSPEHSFRKSLMNDRSGSDDESRTPRQALLSLSKDNFDFKRRYYESMWRRTQRKGHGGDSKSELPRPTKRITSQVTLLKTLDELYNNEGNANRRGKCTIGDSGEQPIDHDTQALRQQMFLLKYYKGRLQKHKIFNPMLSKEATPNKSTSIRIRKDMSGVPSVLGEERLRSLYNEETSGSTEITMAVSKAILKEYEKDEQLGQLTEESELSMRSGYFGSVCSWKMEPTIEPMLKPLTKRAAESNQSVGDGGNNKITTYQNSSFNFTHLQTEVPNMSSKSSVGGSIKSPRLSISSKVEESSGAQTKNLCTPVPRKSKSVEVALSAAKSPRNLKQPEPTSKNKVVALKDKGDSQANMKNKVRFADQPSSNPTLLQSWERSDEDTWCYSINAMLLRANKAQEACDFKKNNHRFPRPDSAKIVSPVVPKSSTFLSELLKQDHMDRKQARKGVVTKVPKKVEEKLARLILEKNEVRRASSSRSSLHFSSSASRSQPRSKPHNSPSPKPPVNRIPTIPTNVAHSCAKSPPLVAESKHPPHRDENSAGVLKIQISSSKRLAERQWTTDDNLFREAEDEMRKRVYEEQKNLPKRLVPLRIKKFVDFTNPDSRNLRRISIRDMKTAALEGSARSSMPVFEPATAGEEILGKQNKESNFLLDRYSDTFRYYQNSHLEKSKLSIVQMYTDSTNSDINNNSRSRPPECHRDTVGGDANNKSKFKQAQCDYFYLQDCAPLVRSQQDTLIFSTLEGEDANSLHGECDIADQDLVFLREYAPDKNRGMPDKNEDRPANQLSTQEESWVAANLTQRYKITPQSHMSLKSGATETTVFDYVVQYNINGARIKPNSFLESLDFELDVNQSRGSNSTCSTSQSDHKFPEPGKPEWRRGQTAQKGVQQSNSDEEICNTSGIDQQLFVKALFDYEPSDNFKHAATAWETNDYAPAKKTSTKGGAPALSFSESGQDCIRYTEMWMPNFTNDDKCAEIHAEDAVSLQQVQNNTNLNHGVIFEEANEVCGTKLVTDLLQESRDEAHHAVNPLGEQADNKDHSVMAEHVKNCLQQLQKLREIPEKDSSSMHSLESSPRPKHGEVAYRKQFGDIKGPAQKQKHAKRSHKKTPNPKPFSSLQGHSDRPTGQIVSNEAALCWQGENLIAITEEASDFALASENNFHAGKKDVSGYGESVGEMKDTEGDSNWKNQQWENGQFHWEEMKVPPPFKKFWDPKEEHRLQQQPVLTATPVPEMFVSASCPSEYSTSTASIGTPNSPLEEDAQHTQCSNTTEIREEMNPLTKPAFRLEMTTASQLAEDCNTTSLVSDGFAGDDTGHGTPDISAAVLSELEVVDRHHFSPVSPHLIRLNSPKSSPEQRMNQPGARSLHLLKSSPGSPFFKTKHETKVTLPTLGDTGGSRKLRSSSVSREFLKTLRGSDIIQAIGLDNARLVESLKAVTKYSSYIPAFQLRSIEPVEMTPLVLEVHYCSQPYPENRWSSTSTLFRAWTVFYARDSGGYLYSIHTVHCIPQGLYSLYTYQENDNELSCGIEVKAAKLIHYSHAGSDLALDGDQIYLFGKETRVREQALEALVFLHDQLSGEKVSHYFGLFCGWVPPSLSASSPPVFPPIHQKGAALVRNKINHSSDQSGEKQETLNDTSEEPSTQPIVHLPEVTSKEMYASPRQRVINELHLPYINPTPRSALDEPEVPSSSMTPKITAETPEELFNIATPTNTPGIPEDSSVNLNSLISTSEVATVASEVPEMPPMKCIPKSLPEESEPPGGMRPTFLCLRCGDVMSGKPELCCRPLNPGSPFTTWEVTNASEVRSNIASAGSNKPGRQLISNWEISGTGMALQRHTRPRDRKSQSAALQLARKTISDYPSELPKRTVTPNSVQAGSVVATSPAPPEVIATSAPVPPPFRKQACEKTKNASIEQKTSTSILASPHDASSDLTVAQKATAKISSEKPSIKSNTTSFTQLSQKTTKFDMAGWGWALNPAVKEDEKGLMQKGTWNKVSVIPPPFPLTPTTTPAPLVTANKSREKNYKSEYAQHRRKLSHINHSYKSPYWTKKEVKRAKSPVSDSGDDRSSVSHIDTISGISSSSSSEESSSESVSEESASDSESSAAGSDFFTRYANKGGPTSIDDIFKRTLPRQRLPHNLNILKAAREKEEMEQLGYLRGREAVSPSNEQKDALNVKSERSVIFTLSEYDMCSDSEEIKEMWKVCFPEVDFWDRSRRRKFKKTKIWS